jgi:hypothetical protein
MLRPLLLAFFLILPLGSPLQANESERAQFERIVSEQIAAFNADDGPRAYSFAAPVIKMLFPTPDSFMAMVRKGYQPVYRQKSFSFGAITEQAGRPTLEVTIVDANGRLWTALYSFEQQPNGEWKIVACHLVETPAANV